MNNVVDLFGSEKQTDGMGLGFLYGLHIYTTSLRILLQVNILTCCVKFPVNFCGLYTSNLFMYEGLHIRLRDLRSYYS
jgi:hypothetical protein